MAATTEAVWDGFVDDAAAVGPGGPGAAASAYAARSLALVGALLVRDTDLPAVPAGTGAVAVDAALDRELPFGCPAGPHRAYADLVDLGLLDVSV